MSVEGWREYKLTELIEIIGGGTPKTSIGEYWDGDIPWLSVKDFNSGDRKVYKTEKSISKSGLENSSTKLLDKDDIIISARGTVGVLAQLGKPMAFNQSCYGLRANSKSMNNYIYYALKFKLSELKRNTHGSVFDTITRNTFEVLTVSLPPLPEQKAIATTLSVLDDTIELNNQINKKLEEIAQTIFKAWFVDFEPFKDEEFEESELGMIPKGWIVGTISDFTVEMKNGGTPSRKKDEYWVSRDVPWLKTGEIKNAPIIYTEEYISFEGLRNSSAKLLPNNTVVLAMYGATAGKVGLLRFEASTNQACCAMLCDSIKKSIYLYLYLMANQKYIEGLAVGAAQQNLSKETISKLIITIPPDEIIETAPFKEIFDLVENLMRQNQVLSCIRDTLLPKLMSGEIRIPVEEVEAFV